MLSEELLKLAAEELAVALIGSFPEPDQCPHQFSDRFEEKMQSLLSSISLTTQTDDDMRKP